MYLPFEEDASLPRFRDSVGRQKGMPEGFVLYYTNQCPFTAKYIPIPGEMAKVRSSAFQTVHTGTREDAQKAPSPFTTFALFYDGLPVTHEILSEKKFDKILADKGVRKMIQLVRPSEERREQAVRFRQEFFEHGESVINGSELFDKTDDYLPLMIRIELWESLI